MTENLISLTTGSQHLMQNTARPGVGETKGAARLAASSEKAEQLKKACEDMEALFIHQLLKEMRATIPKSGLLGKSHAQDIYTGMLDGQMAQEISQNRGLGLSTLLMRQLGAVENPPDESSR
jgi:flagellar protein FlgJ